MDTLWFKLYIDNPPSKRRMLKLFQQRFRMPHHIFTDLLQQLSEHPAFSKYALGE